MVKHPFENQPQARSSHSKATVTTKSGLLALLVYQFHLRQCKSTLVVQIQQSLLVCAIIIIITRMRANAQRDGRPAEYSWRPLQKLCNSIPCTKPQSLADAHCWSAMQYNAANVGERKLDAK